MLSKSWREAVDELFADYDRPNTPGCALGMIRDHQLVYARGYGMANLDHGIANTPTTAFVIGSESKQFTGACVALLVEEGVLDLDEHVHRWVSSLPSFCREITLDHLLHHTSGLPDYHGTPDYEARQMAYRSVSQEELVDFAIHRFDRLDFAPGTRCHYSNTGYLLLAVIVQGVTGMPFGRFLRERVLDPLGMRHTCLPDDPGMVIPQRAIGYVQTGDGQYRMRHYWNDIVPGDGKMISTVEDLAIWDRNFYEPRIGGEQFIPLMHSHSRLKDGSVCRYGFGLDMGQFAPADYAGIPLVTHGGAHGGFESVIVRLPSRRLSVILLCNVRDKRFRPMAMQIAEIMVRQA